MLLVFFDFITEVGDRVVMASRSWADFIKNKANVTISQMFSKFNLINVDAIVNMPAMSLAVLSSAVLALFFTTLVLFLQRKPANHPNSTPAAGMKRYKFLAHLTIS